MIKGFKPQSFKPGIGTARQKPSSMAAWIPKAAGAAVLAVFPLVLSSYGLSLMIQVLIFGLFAVSLNILVGYAGLFSFNHATFFGVSAYTAGILFLKGIDNFWILLAAGVVASMILAAVLGLIIFRSSGPYFFMLTLAFGQMIFAIAWKWRSMTGGDDGLPGVGRPSIGVDLSLWEDRNYYYLVLAVFLAVLLFLQKLAGSALGRTVVGVRESETRMQALGYNTWMVKFLVYVFAAGLAAVAGFLHVCYNGFISPQELNWTLSGMVMLMVIIGGTGSLIGPAVGAATIVILQNLISAYTERWPFLMGGIFILCVMYAREGITGYVKGLVQSAKRPGGKAVGPE